MDVLQNRCQLQNSPKVTYFIRPGPRPTPLPNIHPPRLTRKPCSRSRRRGHWIHAHIVTRNSRRLNARKSSKKNWICVAQTSQLSKPGDILRVKVAGQTIILTKDKSNKLGAFYNTCRHRGTELVKCDKTVNQKHITCPYHHWCYGLDGTLLAAPEFKDRKARGKQKLNFDASQFALIPVKVDTWGHLVFVNLDPECGSIWEQLGDLPDRFANYPQHEMESVRIRKYECHSNWKLLIENFLEWYHLKAVHPDLCKYSPPSAHEAYGPSSAVSGKWCGFRTRPLTNGGTPADTDKFNMLEGLSEADRNQLTFYMVYPNAMVSLYPHSAYTLIANPDLDNPAECTETLHLLMHPDAKKRGDSDAKFEAKVDALMDFVCQVNDEDVVIVNQVQTGIMNEKYPGGRFSPTSEKAVHDFQQLVINDMIA
eukprot:197824_1